MSQLVLRLFDPMRDEHSVQWLLDKWQGDMYGPVSDWIEDILKTKITRPDEVIMPDNGDKQVYGFRTCLNYLISSCVKS